MELIRLTGYRRSASGKASRLGLFFCPFCKKEVERVATDGKRNKSCGCARTSAHVTHSTVPGGKRIPELSVVWGGIKARCYNSGNSAYHRYGGRGIIVCQEWLNNPSLFFKWAIDNGWEKGLEVDRVENDGPYSPDNCQIVTHAENSRNRSTGKLSQEMVDEMRRLFAEGGVTKQELGDRFGVTDATAGKIINRKIWA